MKTTWVRDHQYVRMSTEEKLAKAKRIVRELEEKLALLRTGAIQNENTIQQILGKALGYPWYKDDPKNFPDATEEHGVCVGEHVAASLAAEAADKIRDLTTSLDAERRCNESLRAERYRLWAAIELAADDEAFFIHRENDTVVCSLNLNDTKDYALAYCKDIPWEDVPKLLAIRKQEGWPGLVRWASEQEGWTPNVETQESMNAYDTLRAEIAKLTATYKEELKAWAKDREERDRLRAMLQLVETYMTSPQGHGCLCRCSVIDGHTGWCPVMRTLTQESI